MSGLVNSVNPQIKGSKDLQDLVVVHGVYEGFNNNDHRGLNKDVLPASVDKYTEQVTVNGVGDETKFLQTTDYRDILHHNGSTTAILRWV